jgi:hypothetical protein
VEKSVTEFDHHTSILSLSVSKASGDVNEFSTDLPQLSNRKLWWLKRIGLTSEETGTMIATRCGH